MWNRMAFILVCIVVGVPAMGAKEEIKPLAIGSTAPDFNLPGVDDKSYQLKDFADSDILVVIFTCNHCPTAQAYEERIKKLVTDYKDKGVAVVAISSAVRISRTTWFRDRSTSSAWTTAAGTAPSLASGSICARCRR